MTFVTIPATPYKRHSNLVVGFTTIYLLAFLMMFFISLPSQAKGKHIVENVRFRSTPDSTRVVIVMNSPAQYTVGHLTKPDRLYVDLQYSSLAPKWSKKQLNVGDGRLHMVRIAQNRMGIVRVVLDLPVIPHYATFTLNNPDRIVIDLKDQLAAISTSVAKATIKPQAKSAHRPKIKTVTIPAEKPSPTTAKMTKATSLTPAPKPTNSIRTIVLDPGHGGKDPGALSPQGIQEKQVVLQVALELRNIIRHTLPQYRVILTRQKDVFIPLAERAKIANRNRAEIFISIHANASKRRQVSGIETWYFDFAAHTERAQRIAARENNMSTHQFSELERILRDLHETDRINQSAILAGMTQNSLVQYMKTKQAKILNRGVDGAPFIVLLQTEMPSVLVEIGFVSNPTEAKRLRSQTYQKALAQGIFRGIRKFLRQSVVSAD